MSRQDILELAKLGNPKAIAALINRSLKPQGITAKVGLKDGCLCILVESDRVPAQQALVAFIRRGMMSLKTEAFETVKIYGRQLGTDSPAWKQTIELRTNTAFIPTSKLPDQTSSPLPLQDAIVKQPHKNVTVKRAAAIKQTIQQENPFLNFKARYLFLWFILISLAWGLIAGISGFDLKEPINLLTLNILIFSSVSFWVLGRLKRVQINPQRIIGNLPTDYHWIPTVGLVFAVLLFSLATFWLSYYVLSFTTPSYVEQVLTEKSFGSASESFAPILYYFLYIITLVVVAPVTEEFLFRGILLHRWAAKWGINSAILVSSLVFGLLHRNFIGLSVFGVVVALLYIRTRTLIIPIVFHAVNNAVAVGWDLLLASSDSVKTVNTLDQFRSQLWVGVLFLILSAPWVIRFISKNWPTPGQGVPYIANAVQP